MAEPKKPDSELTDRELLLEIIQLLRTGNANARSYAHEADYNAGKLRSAFKNR